MSTTISGTGVGTNLDCSSSPTPSGSSPAPTTWYTYYVCENLDGSTYRIYQEEPPAGCLKKSSIIALIVVLPCIFVAIVIFVVWRCRPGGGGGGGCTCSGGCAGGCGACCGSRSMYAYDGRPGTVEVLHNVSASPYFGAPAPSMKATTTIVADGRTINI